MANVLTDVERIFLQAKGRLPRRLFVLAGPSGVGKNTIARRLLTNNALMDRVRTYTTRPPREDEAPGAQYHFVSPEEFHALALAGKLMEADAATAGHDVYGLGHLYSMPADIFADLPPDRHLVLAEVDIHGMRRLRARYPDCTTVFVTATPEELIRRIEGRRDEHMNQSALAQRIQTAYEQLQAAAEFDYFLINGGAQLDATVAAIERIIAVERNRVLPGLDLAAALLPQPTSLDVQ